MLKHSVYSLRRQNTRIAKEYSALSREIARHNVDDIEGARDFLRRTFASSVYQGGEKLENRISQIAARHRLDHEILDLLANIRQKQGKLTEAIAYLSEVITTGAPSAEYLIRRAELNVRTNRLDEAKVDLSEALNIPVGSFFELVRWISLARQVDRSILRELPNSEAVQTLSIDDKRFIAWELLERDEDTDIADVILQSILDTPELSDDERQKTYSTLALPLIRDGKFAQVIEYISDPEDIRDTFNLAMAHWGRDGEPHVDLLTRVIELHESSKAPSVDSANYDFCIAIALWVVGRTEDAGRAINRARQEARDEVSQIFSPWRYRNVSTVDFLEDLEAADEAMRAGAMVPEIVSASDEQSGDKNA
jgi:tetratricopeptide (TPR) repeat protein